jgi:hypothetical protein
VEVYDTLDDLAFAYDLTQSGNRNSLDKIEKNGENLFLFEYYDELPMPNFITGTETKPLSQDAWKFYNNAINEYALNIPNSKYVCNNKPNFLATRLGALKRVIYPTGGFSEISYSQNQVKTEIGVDSEALELLPATLKFQLILKPNMPEFVGKNKVEKVKTIKLDHPAIVDINHAIKGRVRNSHVVLSIKNTDGNCKDVFPQNVAGDYYERVPYAKQYILQRNLKLNPDLSPICAR